MKYYKNTNGEVYAYAQSDIGNVGRIVDLENQLEVLQQWQADTPEPPEPKTETDDDGNVIVIEDKYSEARDEYKQKQDEAEAIQSQFDGILPVFFDIKNKLGSLVELSGAELDEHLNPTPTTEQIAAKVREERDAKIEAVRWRIERAKDEAALGIPLTEPLEPLLQYVQDLRDAPEQTNFPKEFVWPIEPELPR